MIEILINGEALDLSKDTSLTLQDNIFSPVDVASKETSYSYTFKVPSTDKNNRLLAHWNVLEGTQKETRFEAELVVDGNSCFRGSMVVKSFDGQSYSLNLVSIKYSTVNEALSGKTMADIKWEIPYNGVATINAMNADMTQNDVFFPLVCYGAFQKTPTLVDEVANEYTSKFVIDSTNKWWHSSFYPSVNLLELLKKSLETGGFTIGGSAFSDPNLKNIYLSTHLANDQVPTYNLGNQLFGHISGTTTFDTSTATNRYIQELNYPYFKLQESMGDRSAPNTAAKTYYQWSLIDWWNLLDTEDSTVTMSHNSYTFEKNEHIIVIPADGWYKVKLKANCKMASPNSYLDACELYVDYWQGDGMQTKTFTNIEKDNAIFAPLEIQLVRNLSDEDRIELIKGGENTKFLNGDPTQATFNFKEGEIGFRDGGYVNRVNWKTEFPHQNLYTAEAPTITESLVSQGVSINSVNIELLQGAREGGTARPTTGGRATNGGGTSQGTGLEDYQAGWRRRGYLHTNTHVFDQGVTNSFICGLSSMGNGIPSVARNGRSWSKMISDKNDVFANVEGYGDYKENRISSSSMVTQLVSSQYCQNQWLGAPRNRCDAKTKGVMSGTVECCMWLNRNDRVELVAVQRDYFGKKPYSWSGTVDFEITAISPRNRAYLEAHNYAYSTPTQFPVNLQLSEFFNKEMAISDFLDNVVKTLNLELIQEGNQVDVNVAKTSGDRSVAAYAVDIDDRVSTTKVSDGSAFGIERIDWPRSLSVQWSIDTSEFGFQNSIPWERRGDDDADQYGDSGTTILTLSNDTYATDDKSVSSKFSYTWYGTFELSGDTSKFISIPVIAADDKMIDYNTYEDDLSYDGFSLAQRMWYRQAPSTDTVKTTSNADWVETVYLTYPTGTYQGTEVSFKTGSTLLNYFTLRALFGSEYTNVDCYLTAEEYKLIKGGAMVHFNADLYYCSSIQWSPTSKLAKLKLMRKTD